MPRESHDHRRRTSFTITDTAHELLTLLAQERGTTRTAALEALIRQAAALHGLWRELAAHAPRQGENR
jgi:hypothetical protein